MNRREENLNAMLRHLGAAYYDATQGRASRSDVTRALDTVAEMLDEEPAHGTNGKTHGSRPATRRSCTHPPVRQVQDVMTTSVVTVDRITPYKEIARLLSAHKISGVPVLMMGRQVAGVVTEADLMRVREQAARRTRDGKRPWWRWPGGQPHPVLTAAGLMTSPAITIHAQAPIPSAVRLMTSRHIRRLPVVDDDGELAGIVSRRDLLSVFLRSDEEIASDVRDVLAESVSTAVNLSLIVRNGVVTLAGMADDLAHLPDRQIWGIDGVIDVIHRPAGQPPE